MRYLRLESRVLRQGPRNERGTNVIPTMMTSVVACNCEYSPEQNKQRSHSWRSTGIRGNVRASLSPHTRSTAEPTGKIDSSVSVRALRASRSRSDKSGRARDVPLQRNTRQSSQHPTMCADYYFIKYYFGKRFLPSRIDLIPMLYSPRTHLLRFTSNDHPYVSISNFIYFTVLNIHK